MHVEIKSESWEAGSQCSITRAEGAFGEEAHQGDRERCEEPRLLARFQNLKKMRAEGSFIPMILFSPTVGGVQVTSGSVELPCLSIYLDGLSWNLTDSGFLANPSVVFIPSHQDSPIWFGNCMFNIRDSSTSMWGPGSIQVYYESVDVSVLKLLIGWMEVSLAGNFAQCLQISFKVQIQCETLTRFMLAQRLHC